MKVIPLTVMVHEGPIARAYLAVLRHLGQRPARLVRLISSHNKITGKPIGRWLPGNLRKRLSGKIQDARNNYWARKLRRDHPQLFALMKSTISESLDLPKAIFDEVLSFTDYSEYGEDVDSVFIRNLNDKRLFDYLHTLAPAAVLFTGGGLLPESILNITGLRFIHFHPAKLPYIRGSDGLLWSTLVLGQPSASCFYMVPGIDQGEIIETIDYPNITFPTSNGDRPKDEALYRALFAYYDPFVRAKLLERIAHSSKTFIDLPTSRQDLSEGNTYTFTHPVLRKAVLEQIFPTAAQ